MKKLEPTINYAELPYKNKLLNHMFITPHGMFEE